MYNPDFSDFDRPLFPRMKNTKEETCGGSDEKKTTPRNSADDVKKTSKRKELPEKLVPPSLLKTLSFLIDCAPLQPRLRDFKVTDTMLLLKVPSYMNPPLEYCDHLLSINDTEFKNQQELHDFITEVNKNTQPYTMLFKVRRVMGIELLTNPADLPMNASLRRKKAYDPRQKPNDGYEYYRTTVVYFPKSKLGLNVKSYEEVVYVDLTDNTWESTMRRYLFVGDAILKIDDQEVRDVKTTQQLLNQRLRSKGVTTMIIERATQGPSAMYVRSVLTFNKVEDPQISSDVIKICQRELENLEKNGFGPDPKPIYRDRQASSPTTTSARVTFGKSNQEHVIGNDQHNPAIMQKVPNLLNPANVLTAMGR